MLPQKTLLPQRNKEQRYTASCHARRLRGFKFAEAFQTLWRKPWRRAAKLGLERHGRKVLRETIDLDAVLDVMYGPVYYRLLIGGNALSADYTDTLTDIIVTGILKR